MVSAYVLVNVKTGQEDAVLRRLSRRGHVRKAVIVYGAYDIVAEVKTANEKEFHRAINRLRRVKDVTNTITLVVV